ncbi:MAG: HD domain-containing protein [Thermodesulfobacteriota bacterium]|nr:HD domain-containing protein [Thermodesulfobacteriota bacterium]
MTSSSPKEVLQFIAFFNAAVNNIRLYSPDHPQAVRRLETAYTVLSDILSTRETITFMRIENDLVVDKSPIRSREPHPDQFAHILQSAGVERLTFDQGLAKEEFTDFIMAFTAPETPAIKTTAHIKIGYVDAGGSGRKGRQPTAAEKAHIEKMRQARAAGYKALKGVLGEIKQHKTIDMDTVNREIRTLAENLPVDMNPLHLLMPLDPHTNYTARHMINVCLLTLSQAISLGFKNDHVQKIGIAALLFDVGKLFIADDIITKPSALTPAERKIVESHTVKGARYILGMAEIPKLAVLCALEHHRRFDGTGYPALTRGWEPNIVSQMVTIADAFDAMRSQRPYQAPMPMEKIIGILKKEKGTTFHPYLVDRFLQLVLQ